MILDWHLGIVMTNDKDIEKEFGIEVQVDSLIPNEVYPVIAKPLFSSNNIKVPNVGDIVEVLVLSDNPEGIDEGDYGVTEFTDFIYYRTRIFDATPNGKVPTDLLVNYPKRAGLFFAINGTIILIDETKGSESILIRLKTNGPLIKLEANGSKILIGAEIATEAILKGTTFETNLTTFLTGWISALAPLSGAIDPILQTYGATMTGLVNTLNGQTAAWKSTKNFIDS